nr:PREDICTED: sugar transporter ERD6-like 7 [Bemisia tabaci]
MVNFEGKHIFKQLLCSVTAFLTVYASGAWLGWASAVLPKLAAGEIPIAMSPEAISWTVAFIDVGNLLSPLPAGWLMDRCGRIFVLRAAALVYIVAAVLALAASAPVHLYLARLLAGVGKGVAFTAATLYVGEIAGPAIRGALCGVCALMSLAGTLTSMTLGPFVSFQALNFVLLGIPLVELVLSFFIVESPYFFLMRGDDAAADGALADLRDPNRPTLTSEELSAMRAKVLEARNEIGTSAGYPFSRLVGTRANRRALLMVLVTGVLERAGGISCIYGYASTTLPAHPWDPALTVMVFSWLCVIFALIGMSLVDGCGRRPLMIVSTSALTVILLVSAVFYFFYEHPATRDLASHLDYVPHVGLMLYAVFYAIGAGQVPHTLHCELFPTSVKSQASAVATIFLGVSSFATTKIYLLGAQVAGFYLMYLVFALASFANILFCVFYLVETKGKTLAEIHRILSR